MAGGDPAIGRQAARAYGCVACHELPGVRGPGARVGPSLDGFAERRFIAGEEPNRSEVLVHFISNPDSVRPGTAMPDVGVPDRDARHIAAYLYTLR